MKIFLAFFCRLLCHFAFASRKSLRLANLYGLPETQKAKLNMRSILSATGTENLNLAKWLEGKLKPLSAHNTIADAFEFADEIQYVPMNEEDILFSYDVTDFFTTIFSSLFKSHDLCVVKAPRK